MLENELIEVDMILHIRMPDAPNIVENKVKHAKSTDFYCKTNIYPNPTTL